MNLWIWIGFLAFVLAMVVLDLGVLHRRARVISMAEAFAWTGIWVGMALVFNLLIFFLYEDNWGQGSVILTEHLSGRDAAVQFFTGYLLEKSLSFDNIFVIALIFAAFRVPLQEQHRVLFWGVLGAVALRGAMIALGAVLMERVDWIVYLFGVLLIISAVKTLVVRHDNIDPDRNLLVRWVLRHHRVSAAFVGSRFVTMVDGKRGVTPLLLVLILVVTADVMFAVDSIPAIFAITRDPFLVFTSNIFAVLGMRSLYFALSGLMDKCQHVKTSVVFVLAYVGVKMMLSHHHAIPNLVSLAIIGGILSVGILASVARTGETANRVSPIMQDLGRLVKISYREARRVVILIVGFSVILVGVALLLLPGPGVLAILLGLGVLAAEFAWARRWLAHIKDSAEDARHGVSAWWRRGSGRSTTPRRGQPDGVEASDVGGGAEPREREREESAPTPVRKDPKGCAPPSARK